MFFRDNINDKKTVRIAPLKMLSILSLLSLLFVSCREVPVVEPQQELGDVLKENRINANRLVAKSEENQIDAYVARRGWQMERLRGGGRVMVTREGNGKKIDYEETVVVRWSVETLGGERLYSNVTDTLVAGHMQPTRGFDEALLTLRHGSSARVVLPSEQGYGVVGDGDQIGSRTVLVYELIVKNK